MGVCANENAPLCLGVLVVVRVERLLDSSLSGVLVCLDPRLMPTPFPGIAPRRLPPPSLKGSDARRFLQGGSDGWMTAVEVGDGSESNDTNVSDDSEGCE
jgi:hypothetical protein